MSATIAERRQRDVLMMQTPSDWPQWPLLPLVHRTASQNEKKFAALLFPDGRPVIYFALLFMLPIQPGRTWSDILGSLDKQEYPSFEALAAEYRVD